MMRRTLINPSALALAMMFAAAAPAAAGSDARPLSDLSRAVFASSRIPQVSRIPGVAKTAVEYGRTKDGGAAGALGFLCGLKPSADRSGAGQAYGVDPTGRFVGAKLRVAF